VALERLDGHASDCRIDSNVGSAGQALLCKGAAGGRDGLLRYGMVGSRLGSFDPLGGIADRRAHSCGSCPRSTRYRQTVARVSHRSKLFERHPLLTKASRKHENSFGLSLRGDPACEERPSSRHPSAERAQVGATNFERIENLRPEGTLGLGRHDGQQIAG
jgi:hypothetical protein